MFSITTFGDLGGCALVRYQFLWAFGLAGLCAAYLHDGVGHYGGLSSFVVAQYLQCTLEFAPVLRAFCDGAAKQYFGLCSGIARIIVLSMMSIKTRILPSAVCGFRMGWMLRNYESGKINLDNAKKPLKTR